MMSVLRVGTEHMNLRQVDTLTEDPNFKYQTGT